MPNALLKAQLALRRGVLAMVLLVPERWRAALSRSRLLSRIYEFFDRAKYASPAPEPEVRKSPPSSADSRPDPAPAALPHADYVYREPEPPPGLESDIAASRALGRTPMFSVVMPVYNTDPAWLESAVRSVQAQWYPNWELCIADDASDRAETLRALQSLDDPRIKVHRLEANQHISEASNAALQMASGEYIALLDHDDELTPDALYRVWEAIKADDPDFIYSDEDKIDSVGRHCQPHFKPDFSPDQFLSQNYLCHLAVMRRTLALEVGGFTAGMEGAQDYDLFLKVLERTERIVHLPRVLYHWRMTPGSTAARFSHKSYAQDAGQHALEAAIERRGLNATVTAGRFPGTYRVRYAIEGAPLVSIVVPFKDHPELLRSCLSSIVGKSTWEHFEIIGVSNNSEDPKTFEEMERWRSTDPRIRFVEHDVPFNYSGINNYAVREHAKGEYVLLLNNDVEIITPDWIESLLEFAQRPDVGVVGALLYYPDGHIQHAGIILGIGGVGGHSHKRLRRGEPGYFSRPNVIQNLSAVTGACCLMRKHVFEAVGGLDEENFAIAFNDVDFCLRVRAAGYLNVYTPYCEAWHHESHSRGLEDTPEKQARFAGEVQRFKARHEDALAKGDPYYNPNLTLDAENFLLARSLAGLSSGN